MAHPPEFQRVNGEWQHRESPPADERVAELVTLILTALNMSPDPLSLWSNVESRVNQHFYKQASR
jgi:hypothetical protein